jgi:hypothetical protein
MRQDSDHVALAGYDGLMRDRAVVTPGFFNLLIVLVGLAYQRICAVLVRRFYLSRSDRTTRIGAAAARQQKFRAKRGDARG